MLILLRHGRTPNNAASRLQGQFDSPLDDVGVAQAEAAGRYLRERFAIDHVVTSALERTRETARHAGFSGDGVEVDDRWREIDFGEYTDRHQCRCPLRDSRTRRARRILRALPTL